MAIDTTRCDNLSCLCEIPLAQTSCSDYCSSDAGKDPTEIVCKCGHEKCRQANDAQLHGGGGAESP